MATILKITSRPGGAIRHSGSVRSVAPEEIAKALGAEVVSRENVHGAPIALRVLRQELERRVRSTGGRPALEGATKIQKIPLKPEDWSRLEELSRKLSRPAGQVASILLHNQLEAFAPSRTRLARAARRT